MHQCYSTLSSCDRVALERAHCLLVYLLLFSLSARSEESEGGLKNNASCSKKEEASFQGPPLAEVCSERKANGASATGESPPRAISCKSRGGPCKSDPLYRRTGVPGATMYPFGGLH